MPTLPRDADGFFRWAYTDLIAQACLTFPAAAGK